jgi:hypothetical protein
MHDTPEDQDHEHEHELGPLAELVTLRDWLRYAVTRFNRAGLFFGHGCADAYDEAVWLLLHTLSLPLGRLEPFLDACITTDEREALLAVIERRAEERIPAAYLTGEAWLGDFRFAVDERVIVPRSFFAELLENAERRHLLVATPWEQPEHPFAGINAQRGARFGATGPPPIRQGVPDIRRGHSRIPKEAGLEGEDHREGVDGPRETRRASGPPSPELRRDVVQNGHTCLAGRLGHTQVKPGIVDQQHQIVLASPKGPVQGAEQAPMRRHLSPHLDESHDGVGFHRVPDGGAGRRHTGATEGIDRRVREATEELRDHRRPVQVARGFPRPHENA